MDENKKDNQGYEPNFILKDTPDQESGVTHDKSDKYMSYEDMKDIRNAENTGQGEFRDPRENFRKKTSSEEYSHSFDYSPSNHYNNHSGNFSEYNGCHGKTETQSGSYQESSGYQTNSGYSGDYSKNSNYSDFQNMNNRKKAKNKKPRKPSPPVSFTRRSLVLTIVICIAATLLLCTITTFFLFATITDNNTAKKSSVSNDGYTLEDATGSNMTVQEITDSAKDSVVEIKTESVSSDAWMQQYVTEGAGSGVIITKDGYIMTNNHVIDGAGKITVTTSDEKEYEAKLIGTDSLTDVAVLKINANDLTPVTYGNSDQLDVGDLAVAIGNPLGELGGTVTAGIISALDRQLSIDGKSMTLLQTDSSINPGNSGGGLFNSDGQLIGLVVAKSSGSDVEGLGFAIPINKAADVAQQLMDKGYVSGQPFTGMSYSEIGQNGNMNQLFGHGGQSQGGAVYIQEVSGENAKKAGFKSGDLVYAVDDTPITSFNELSSIVTSHKVGDKLKFTVIRNNQKINIKLTLEEKKAE